MTSPVDRPSVGATRPEPRRFPEGAAHAVAAVFGAAIVLASLVVGGRFFDGSSSPEEVPPPTSATLGGVETPTVTRPPSTTAPPDAEAEQETPPEPSACAEVNDPVVCDLVAFVERERGRAFVTPPVVEVLDADRFTAALGQAPPSAVDPLPGLDAELTSALGLLDGELTYGDAVERWRAVRLDGFAAADGSRVVVRGPELDLYRQGLAVRELTIALDHQLVPVDPVGGMGPDEAFGQLALRRGDGVRIARRWIDGLDGADRSAHDRLEAAALGLGVVLPLNDVPGAVRELWDAPALDGAAYTAWVVAESTERGLDEALIDPPPSGEQVLHPGRDRAGLPDVIVPLPPADGEILAQGRLGEAVLRAWLGRLAADGWAGDRFVRWAVGESVCVRVDIATDTVTDGADVATAAERWVAAAPALRSAEAVVNEAGPLLRLRGCS